YGDTRSMLAKYLRPELSSELKNAIVESERNGGVSPEVATDPVSADAAPVAVSTPPTVGTSADTGSPPPAGTGAPASTGAPAPSPGAPSEEPAGLSSPAPSS
ncbi:MAG: hypothetical protein QGF59_13430, partial [Pirellulaceae bacterium]|nr:hypothetical protein [Pirellulaceae bacterium]